MALLEEMYTFFKTKVSLQPLYKARGDRGIVLSEFTVSSELEFRAAQVALIALFWILRWNTSKDYSWREKDHKIDLSVKNGRIHFNVSGKPRKMGDTDIDQSVFISGKILLNYHRTIAHLDNIFPGWQSLVPSKDANSFPLPTFSKGVQQAKLKEMEDPSADEEKINWIWRRKWSW